LGAQSEAEFGLRGKSGRVRIFYACGTDHAERCGLYNGLPPGPGRDVGVVVVPRQGEEPRREKPKRLVFVAEPAPGKVAGFSSTKVRQALAACTSRRVSHETSEGELHSRHAMSSAAAESYISSAMSPEAAQVLLHPTERHFELFPELRRLHAVL